MEKKLKVLVVPTWYPSGKDKLMGIYHKEFCTALCGRDDVDVDILFIERNLLKKPLKYLFMKKFVVDPQDGYTTYIYRMLNLAPISFSLQMKSYVKKMRRAYKDYEKRCGKPDIIHAQVTVPAGYAAAVIGKENNIPVLITEHTVGHNFFLDHRKEYAEFASKNAHMTSVSNFFAKKIEEQGVDCCGVLPNVVDCALYNNVVKKPSEDGTLRLCCVFALREDKRVDIVASAQKLLMESGRIPKIHFTIVGDGFLEADYKKAVADIGMNDHVDFVGRKNKNEIAEIFAETDIFVVPSSIETFCIPGLEALASGVPVVSTRCFGPEEYVDENCGEFCQFGSAEDMADAIERVYHKLSEYDTTYLKKAAEPFSHKNVAAKAMELYRSIINS